MYFPDNFAGLAVLSERVGGFLRHCFHRARHWPGGVAPPNAEAPHWRGLSVA